MCALARVGMVASATLWVCLHKVMSFARFIRDLHRRLSFSYLILDNMGSGQNSRDGNHSADSMWLSSLTQLYMLPLLPPSAPFRQHYGVHEGECAGTTKGLVKIKPKMEPMATQESNTASYPDHIQLYHTPRKFGAGTTC